MSCCRLDFAALRGYKGRMLIDTHCHLVHRQFTDIAALRAESEALGVPHCICQGTGPQDWAPQIALAQQLPSFISSCLAVHPSECTEAEDEDLERMRELCLAHPQAAIGETGLDYYWNAPEGWSEKDYRARQHRYLEYHYALAEELGLNICLHTRDKQGHGSACFDDAFAIARNFPRVRPVFHCFIGTRAQAEAIFSELDGLISFTGILTFKKSEQVQEVAASCPADRFMLETDAPYLSPEPFRGQLNIPGRTRFVAEKVAELRGISLEEVAALSTATARRFFRLSPGA